MLSERAYWIILISSLSIFMVIDLFWVYPVIIGNLPSFGKDLFTNVLFTIFTIVFLTWGITIREERTWRIVGKKVEERIEYRLQKILVDVSTYFLEPPSQLLDKETRKGHEESRQPNRIEEERAMTLCIAEYYAETENFELGKLAKTLLEKRDEDLATYLMENFRRESDFLEHIVSEYPDFLPPEFMYSIMEIQDALDEVADVLWVASKLGSVSEEDSETTLCDAIRQIMKEIRELNKKGFAFSNTSRKI